MNIQLFNSISFFLIISVLTACGGGGAGDGGDISPAGSTVDVTYSKGPVSGASAILLDLNGNTVAGPVTTVDGKATFTNVTYSGLVYAHFLGGSYVDEATGGVVNLGSAFLIRSGVIDNTGSKGRSLSLVATPLTEIGFQRASDANNGNLVLEDINFYISEVADEFGLDGIDLSTVAPTTMADITGTVARDQYGVVLAAISLNILLDSGSSTDSGSLTNYITAIAVNNIDVNNFNSAVSELQNNANTAPFISSSLINIILSNSGITNSDTPTPPDTPAPPDPIKLLQNDIRSRMTGTILFSAQTVMDLDGDNDMDVVATYTKFPEITKETIVFYRNIGNNNFLVEEKYKGWFRTAIVDDFNNDGLDDLFFADHGPDPGGLVQDQLFLQNSTGEIIEKTLTNLPALGDFSHGACSGDIDGNGYVDLITNEGGKQKFMLNTGGVFTKEDSVAPAFAVQRLLSFWSCATGDFNNDGFVDVLLGPATADSVRLDVDGNWITPSTTILYGNVNGTLDYLYPESLLPTSNSSTATAAVTTLAHDFNNDGCLDGAVQQTDIHTIHSVDILYGDCAMGFTKQYFPFWTDNQDHPWLDNAVIHDMNNDGFDDIIYFESVRSWGNDYTLIRIMENQGVVGFTIRPANLSDFDLLPLHVKISFDRMNNIDTDGDGVLDIDDAFPVDGTKSVDTDGDGVN